MRSMYGKQTDVHLSSLVLHQVPANTPIPIPKILGTMPTVKQLLPKTQGDAA